ncbi:ABC transporter substrate-binding protein [Cerasicoccus fimbriatus]|uniref:ABC transporter substrate-binding protein n=1 Tax=Cerasicoccus fimbriatus TaxID=3014554 RepID=UPI0022B59A6E|nr:ABC transporter substrate-binding protein [Cerasicoccus sp. TK19100]
MNKLRVISSLLGLLALLAGCGGPQKQATPEIPVTPVPEDALVEDFPAGEYGAMMVETLAGDIATVNPLISEDQSSSSIISRLQSGLVTLDPFTGEVIPELAKSWEISEDKLEYTFYLRKGVTWSDGHPLTADDVVFSWEVIYAKEIDEATGEVKLDAESGAPVYRFPTRSAFFQLVNGQEPKAIKIDDYTVKLVTPEVYAPFLLFGGGMDILPKHALQPFVDDGSLLDQWSINTAINEPWKIVGSGPFLMESYRPGERIVLKRNPNYWKVNPEGERLPYIERNIYKIVGDTSASNMAFREGQTDIEGISPDNVTWIEWGAESQDYRVIDNGPSSTIQFVWFNLNPGKDAEGKPYVEPYKFEWFSNKTFRQALSYGVNRPGIIKGVYLGRASELQGYVSPKRKFWKKPDIREYPYDPEKAKALLREAGFVLKGDRLYDAAGNQVAFKLMTNQNNQLRTEMATVFKENMEALGIEVELQFIDFNSLIIKTTASFDYEACLLGLGGGAPDPFASKDILMSGGRLHFWYPEQSKPATEWEKRIDELMIELGRETEPAIRQKIFFEVQDILAEQQPMIMLVTANDYIGIRNRWQNVDVAPLGGVTWNLESLWAEPISK